MSRIMSGGPGGARIVKNNARNEALRAIAPAPSGLETPAGGRSAEAQDGETRRRCAPRVTR